MKKILMTAAATCFALASAANATTIKISTFDIGAFNAATGYSGFVTEDFENLAGSQSYKTPNTDGGNSQITSGGGQLAGALSTKVGTFSSAGGTGTGGVCQESLGGGSGGTCENLYLKNTGSFGQGNLVPESGSWSLNANDTLGIVWKVAYEGGALFNRVVFALMDATDQGATVTVSASGVSETLSGLASGNQQLIVIDFAELVTAATIRIANTRNINDSFSVDGASVGVVPLPAGGLLLLTGLGALALYRRRKQAAA